MFELVEHKYVIEELDEEKRKYFIKNYISGDLKNKVVYSPELKKYFKMIPYYYTKDEPRWMCPCYLCSLRDINHRICDCLDITISKNAELFNKKNTFYFKEIDYYEALFGGENIEK